MEAGQVGAHGRSVQSSVERGKHGEWEPVPIQHHSMGAPLVSGTVSRPTPAAPFAQVSPQTRSMVGPARFCLYDRHCFNIWLDCIVTKRDYNNFKKLESHEETMACFPLSLICYSIWDCFGFCIKITKKYPTEN